MARNLIIYISVFSIEFNLIAWTKSVKGIHEKETNNEIDKENYKTG